MRTVLIRPAISDMDAIDDHEVLRGPSVGLVPVLVRYGLSTFIGWCQYSP
jgi:hypothetical protein